MSEVMVPVRSLRVSSFGVVPAQDRSPRIVRIVGDITLMEGWTSDNPDRTFTNQSFEIREQTKSSRLGRDGHLIVTCRPMNVTWYGGKSEYLRNITHVRIATRGRVLVDESLDTQRARSKAVPGGTSFDVTTQA